MTEIEFIESIDAYFPFDDLGSIESLIRPNTKVLYAESPTNPGVDVLDLEALGAIARRHGLWLIIDNCFATPYLQQPIRFGADVGGVAQGRYRS